MELCLLLEPKAIVANTQNSSSSFLILMKNFLYIYKVNFTVNSVKFAA